MRKVTVLLFLIVLFFGTGCFRKGVNGPTCNNIESVQLTYEFSDGKKVDTTITNAIFLKEFSYWFGQMKAVDKDRYSAKTNYFLIVGNVKCGEGTTKFMMYFTKYSGAFVDMNYTYYQCRGLVHFILRTLDLEIKSSVEKSINEE